MSIGSYENMYAHLVQMWAYNVQNGDGTAKTAFYGDSRVAGADWYSAYPDYDIVNLGVGGDKVEQTITRLSLLDAYEVKHCFLAIGGNNALSDSFDSACFRTNYDRLLTELESRSITVYVNTVAGLTRAKASESRKIDRKNNNIKTVNSIIKELAAAHNMTVIDMAGLMNDSEGYLQDQYACSDGVHFSDFGNQCWFDALEPYVKAAEEAL
ncbi:MAG: hypothetical protein IJ863_08485 [Spirochaetales bacterium]|nr:hypothetical protein [Spirochaetales bacterium]